MNVRLECLGTENTQCLNGQVDCIPTSDLCCIPIHTSHFLWCLLSARLQVS